MLRLLVLLLFIANLLFYAWTRGWLDEATGLRHDGPREPQRLARQVHPEAIQIHAPAASQASGLKTTDTLSVAASSGQPAHTAPEAASSASAVSAAPAASTASMPSTASAAPTGAAQASAASSPGSTAGNRVADTSRAATRCLEAGPFTNAQRKDVETALGTVMPAKSWEVRTQEKAGLWMVYMGRYNSEETLRKKADELRRISSIHIDFIEVRSPPELALGLSLGRFQQRANAESALASFNQHGVRTAHIVTVRTPQTQYFLRVPRADATTQHSLSDLSGALAGKAFGACGEPAAAQ